MKVVITAQVPTAYQYRSIRSIGLPVAEHKDGSYSCYSIYKSKKEAVKLLTERAEILADDEKEFRKMKAQIKRGYLEYDAVIARIDPLIR